MYAHVHICCCCCYFYCWFCCWFCCWCHLCGWVWCVLMGDFSYLPNFKVKVNTHTPHVNICKYICLSLHTFIYIYLRIFSGIYVFLFLLLLQNILLPYLFSYMLLLYFLQLCPSAAHNPIRSCWCIVDSLRVSLSTFIAFVVINRRLSVGFFTFISSFISLRILHPLSFGLRRNLIHAIVRDGKSSTIHRVGLSACLC